MGQGQGPKAEKLLMYGMERGMWVCLQNCHLSQSWMPTLDVIVDNIDIEKVLFLFLFFLVCYSFNFFVPSSLDQSHNTLLHFSFY